MHVDQDGRKPMRMPAPAADADGRLCMTGEWFRQSNDVATTRLSTKAPGHGRSE